MTRVLSVLDFLLALFLLGFPLPAQGQQQPQKIIIAGAQSITPLAEKFSAQFQKQHPGIAIEIRRGNSNYAVTTVRNGEIDIGLVARELGPAERAELHVEPFGHDAIILLSYPWNAVGELTLEQLRKIYLGKITNWREVGGSDKGIVPLTREQSSALHGTFIDSLFGKGFYGQEKAFVLRANKDKVLRTIKRIQGSLGYGIVRVEEAQAEGVKVLGIDGKFPTATNIREELYPFTRPQLLISKGRPDGIIQEWMSGFAKFANRGTGPEEQK
jgi:phosphate transport system substrate-binding protein